MEHMTLAQAQEMAEEIKSKLFGDWTMNPPRKFWLFDEYTIDLDSETLARGWMVRNREDWQNFREKYDLLPCRECGTPFYRETWECPNCGVQRF